MTAWLAPLPPKPSRKARPVRVSPGCGSRVGRKVMSMLAEPTTHSRGASRDMATSEVLFAHGVKDVQGLRGLIQGHDLVPHVTGNAIDVARPERPLLVADVEDGPALQDHADLLVRVRVLL